MINPRRRLFWRIYLNGLLLLVAALVAITLTTIFLQPESRFHGRPEQLYQVLAAELAQNIDKPVQLQITLKRFANTLQRSSAIYHRDGTLIAASGVSLPLPLAAKDFSKIDGWHPIHQEGMGWVHAVSLGNNSDAYFLMEGANSGGKRFFIFLTIVLLVVALASWPLVRALTRPLERLTATSRALAGGDLSARSGVIRKDEIGELASALDEMAKQLEERIRNEKELLANISHEIRTPLARLRVALELCEDGPREPEKIIERLQGMGTDLSELESLIDNVMTSARLDLATRGKAGFPLRLSTIVLVDFFNDVISRFERHYNDRLVKSDIPQTMPIVTGDPLLLSRVCDNLLDNAIKYSSFGNSVFLNVIEEETFIRVEVRDSGEGVPREDLDKLFEPFFRSDRSRTRSTGGAGLGLTLCRRIVEAHGGTISARLNPDKGMTFSFKLPL